MDGKPKTCINSYLGGLGQGSNIMKGLVRVFGYGSECM
jgi:hypothetical protein